MILGLNLFGIKALGDIFDQAVFGLRKMFQNLNCGRNRVSIKLLYNQLKPKYANSKLSNFETLSDVRMDCCIEFIC